MSTNATLYRTHTPVASSTATQPSASLSANEWPSGRRCKQTMMPQSLAAWAMRKSRSTTSASWRDGWDAVRFPLSSGSTAPLSALSIVGVNRLLYVYNHGVSFPRVTQLANTTLHMHVLKQNTRAHLKRAVDIVRVELLHGKQTLEGATVLEDSHQQGYE